MAISMNPDTFTEGGGLLDDVDVEVLESKFEIFNYGGKGPATPALKWKLKPLDDGEAIDQFWSCGSSDAFIPSSDGESLEPTGDATAPRKNSNLHVLLESLKKAGFPMSKLEEGKISVLSGMKCHVVRKPAPRRPGLDQSSEARRYEQTILEVGKIIALPGESGGNSGEATASEGDPDVESMVMGILKKNNGSVAKKDLVPAAFDETKNNPQLRKKAMGMLKDDSWVGSSERPWNFENGIVST